MPRVGLEPVILTFDVGDFVEVDRTIVKLPDSTKESAFKVISITKKKIVIELWKGHEFGVPIELHRAIKKASLNAIIGNRIIDVIGRQGFAHRLLNLMDNV